MNRLKLILIGIAILIIASAFVTVNIQAKKIAKLNSENARLESNNFQLMADGREQTNLYLRQREITGKIKLERDSIAKALKIKPKYIDRIITIDLSTHDTVKVPIPVIISGKNEWNFTDSSKCLKIAYNAKLIGDSLKVVRTSLDNDNKITQVFYKKRPHRFIFRFGKWQYLQKISSDCDGVKYQNIVFEK